MVLPDRTLRRIVRTEEEGFNAPRTTTEGAGRLPFSGRTALPAHRGRDNRICMRPQRWIALRPAGRKVAIQTFALASDSSEKWIPLFGPMP